MEELPIDERHEVFIIMRKPYEKPVLIKREPLPILTAGGTSEGSRGRD
jgi:hypothetical protein